MTARRNVQLLLWTWNPYNNTENFFPYYGCLFAFKETKRPKTYYKILLSVYLFNQIQNFLIQFGYWHHLNFVVHISGTCAVRGRGVYSTSANAIIEHRNQITDDWWCRYRTTEAAMTPPTGPYHLRNRNSTKYIIPAKNIYLLFLDGDLHFGMADCLVNKCIVKQIWYNQFIANFDQNYMKKLWDRYHGGSCSHTLWTCTVTCVTFTF